MPCSAGRCLAQQAPRPRRGLQPGDRLPDAPVTVDHTPTTLHQALAAPGFHLLLAGPTNAWTHRAATTPGANDGLVHTHQLTDRPQPATLIDTDGRAHQRLGLDPNQPAHYLIRPDGHIAHRATGTNLTGVHTHLDLWLAQTT
jgi:hypothetical protein